MISRPDPRPDRLPGPPPELDSPVSGPDDPTYGLVSQHRDAAGEGGGSIQAAVVAAARHISRVNVTMPPAERAEVILTLKSLLRVVRDEQRRIEALEAVTRIAAKAVREADTGQVSDATYSTLRGAILSLREVL